MTQETTATTTSNNVTATTTKPGEGRMEPRYIVAVGLYLVLLSILVLYGLLKIWPYPTPSGEPKDTIQTQADTSQASNTVASPTASPSPTAQASPTATQGQTTPTPVVRSEEHTSELQSRLHLV